MNEYGLINITVHKIAFSIIILSAINTLSHKINSHFAFTLVPAKQIDNEHLPVLVFFGLSSRASANFLCKFYRNVHVCVGTNNFKNK